MGTLYKDDKRGSDCTGTDSTAGRTITLDHYDSSSGAVLVGIIVNNASLNAPDYTEDLTTANLITFNNAIWDTDYIRLVYISGGSITGTTYCDVTDVQRIIQKQVAFSSTTSPTENQVIQAILATEDYIDNMTLRAWRTKTVTEEYYDIPEKQWKYSYWTGVPIRLKHNKIKQFSSADGDKLEIWDGTSWVDWIATKTEGRDKDYWANYNDGRIFLKLFLNFYKEQAVRTTYRYGETPVPEDIKEACALLAAARIITTDDRSFLVSESGDPTRMTHDSRADRWKAEANKILHNYKNFFSL